MIVTDFAPNLDPANAEEVYYLSTLIFDMPAIKPDQTGFILVSLHYLSSRTSASRIFNWDILDKISRADNCAAHLES